MHKQSTHTATSKTILAIQQQSKSHPATQPTQENVTIGNEHFGTKAGAMIDNVMGAIAPPPEVQTDLTVGVPGDKYEQEADRVAKETVQRLYSSGNSGAIGVGENNSDDEGVRLKPLAYNLQRDGGKGAGTASKALEQSLSSAKSGGSELPDRNRYESAMGANFSNIKIHTGGESDRLNRSLSSRAFTNQNHIFFKQGEFNPGTRQGDALIAHELTHTLQQGAASTMEEVQRSPLQVSRAPEGWIQRDVLGEFTKRFHGTISETDDLKTVASLGVSSLKFWKLESTSIELTRKLLKGYIATKEKPESYLFLEKAHNVLVLKQKRQEKKARNNAAHISQPAQEMVSVITLFRNQYLDALVEQEYKRYETTLTQKSAEDVEAADKESDEQSIRGQVLALIGAHKDPDLADLAGDDKKAKKKYAKLEKKYDKHVAKKIKDPTTIPKRDLEKITLDFRKLTSKGTLRKRGEKLTQVDRLLTRAVKILKDDKMGQEAKQEIANDYFNQAIIIMDLWLKKYQPVVKASVQEDAKALGSGPVVEEDTLKALQKSSLESTYKSVYWTQRRLMVATGISSIFEVNASVLGMLGSKATASLGQGAPTDDAILMRMRQQALLKKIKKNYSGDCGFFFRVVYPMVINALAGTVGDKGKFEMELAFPVEPTGLATVGFHLKIDAERKDQKEHKVYNHFVIHAGLSHKDTAVTVKANLGAGFYTEVTGHTAQNCAQLVSYGMRQHFVEAGLEKIASFMWGGGKRSVAESWAESVEETTFGAADDDAKKAYVETGGLARAYAEVGGDVGLASAKGKFEAAAYTGKRWNLETLKARGALVEIKKFKGKGENEEDIWEGSGKYRAATRKSKDDGHSSKQKGAGAHRYLLKAGAECAFGPGNASGGGGKAHIGLGGKWEYLRDVGADNGDTKIGKRELRKRELEVKIGLGGFGKGGKTHSATVGYAIAGGGAAFSLIKSLYRMMNDKAQKDAEAKEKGPVTGAKGSLVTQPALLALGALGMALRDNSNAEIGAGAQLRFKIGEELPSSSAVAKEAAKGEDKEKALKAIPVAAKKAEAAEAKLLAIDNVKKTVLHAEMAAKKADGDFDVAEAKAVIAEATKDEEDIIKETKAGEEAVKKAEDENERLDKMKAGDRRVSKDRKSKAEAHIEMVGKSKQKIDLSGVQEDSTKFQKIYDRKEGKDADGTALKNFLDGFKQSYVGFEFTHRIFSFKWEQKKGAWSGFPVLDKAKKRYEILGVDFKNKEAFDHYMKGYIRLWGTPDRMKTYEKEMIKDGNEAMKEKYDKIFKKDEDAEE
ncbi:MAG: DUF4157 domain-containing protein [Cyanobacteria bacterium SBLK]|nr:DUF4157 domain-containing protein [Cyanobacteria bacterium SBLK]